MSESWVLCEGCESGVEVDSATTGQARRLDSRVESELSQYAAGAANTVRSVLSLMAPAQDVGAEQGRIPVRLSSVLDKSGSMAGDKLRLVKATADFMAGQLQGTDMLSLVAYDHEVSTAITRRYCLLILLCKVTTRVPTTAGQRSP